MLTRDDVEDFAIALIALFWRRQYQRERDLPEFVDVGGEG